jgi:hypothetical protein
MTIDLYRNDDDFFQLEYFGIWQKLMNLAQIYGWNPAGTTAPSHWQPEENEDWNGGYDMFIGELVSDVDARALADALTDALDDLPDNAMPDRIIETEIEEIDREGEVSISFHIIEPNKSLNLFETFGGQYKSELKTFIRFAQKGGFYIHSTLTP